MSNEAAAAAEEEKEEEEEEEEEDGGGGGTRDVVSGMDQFINNFTSVEPHCKKNKVEKTQIIKAT